jgi:hypothetical protein
MNMMSSGGGGDDSGSSTPQQSDTPSGGVCRSFPNQVPETLPEELATAEELGVKPVSPSDPEFADIANAGKVKWAITEQGELKVIPHTVDGVEISHAVITQGDPVLAAGEADIASAGGKPVGLEITPQSGHFMQGNDESTNAGVLELGRGAFKKFGIEFPKSGGGQ